MEFLGKQRDLYKYIHDQSVNLMNKGYVGTEIAEMIKLPPELDRSWYNRGYYGTVKHDARAVYQRYMGWYDANPSTLDQLPPEPAAKKYVEYMGGAAAVLEKARADFDKGEYRWVAEALKHVVFAEPDNREAKELLADTYEQMGYQAESGPWRSIYLMGAFELRNGVPHLPAPDLAGPDTIRAMPPNLLFDYWGVRLNAEKSGGKKSVVGINFTDLKREFTLTLENGVLRQSTRRAAKPDARFTLSKATFDRIQLKEETIDDAIKAGRVKLEGRREAADELLGMLDTFSPGFNIVTP